MAAAINPTSSATATATAGLNLNDLLRVLLTELTNQDPLKPVDNTAFMAQIAQFASLDSTQQMSSNIQQLVGLQAITQTVGLIGRTVSAFTDSGSAISGQVTALALSNGVPLLTITGSDGVANTNISLGNVQTVRLQQAGGSP